MATIRVRAHAAVLGFKAGATGEVEDSDAVKAAIASGKLEKITAAEAKRAEESTPATGGAS